MDFPINSMVIFHGKMLVHQRVSPITKTGAKLSDNQDISAEEKHVMLVKQGIEATKMGGQYERRRCCLSAPGMVSQASERLTCDLPGGSTSSQEIGMKLLLSN